MEGMIIIVYQKKYGFKDQAMYLYLQSYGWLYDWIMHTFCDNTRSQAMQIMAVSNEWIWQVMYHCSAKRECK